MQSIGLLEAVSLWWQGTKLDDYSLYGLSTVWINRGAKVLTFAAGSTVVLDLLGPERIREFGARTARRPQGGTRRRAISSMVALFVVIVVLVTVGLIRLARGPGMRVDTLVAIDLLALLPLTIYLAFATFVAPRLIAAIGRGLEQPRTERAIRWGAVGVLSVAFLIDLLTS